MKVATSAVEVEGGLEKIIKFVEGVSGCVNESIGVSGKGKCKCHDLC